MSCLTQILQYIKFVSHCSDAVVSTGNVSGPVFLDNLRCSSTESSLLECTNELNPIGITSCLTDDAVIVQCPGTEPYSVPATCVFDTLRNRKH